MLEPLKQFVCDRCGGVILSKEDGVIEWLVLRNPRDASGFKIVHHVTKSPRGERGCYHYDDDGPPYQWLHLDDFAGDDVVYNLVFWIDDGPHISEEFRGPFAPNLREWAEVTKRLLLPYYEEARLYIDKACGDSFVDDTGNPHHLYSVSVLKRIAEKYTNYPASE